MQKIKIGHRANFRAKYKCFPQILFPVRAILCSINFRCTDFITDSADACILVMACVDCDKLIENHEEFTKLIEDDEEFEEQEAWLEGANICF